MINEVSLLNAFRDFLTNTEENLIYTAEGGKEYLAKILFAGK